MSRNNDVAIVLCTSDGEHYIEHQLNSIANQSHRDWRLFVSDDGSTDKTQLIVKRFAEFHNDGHVLIVHGPKRGYVANFLSAVTRCPGDSSYFAFCDQDDVWENDKLERAIHWLARQPGNIPALYCSRTRLIDIRGKELGFSPLFKRPPSFANALVQSLAGGNTMVFNRAAKELLVRTNDCATLPSHDWWLYILVTGAGGLVKYDPYPSVRYRQHAGNLIGSSQGMMSRLARLRMLMKGRFRDWSNQNIGALRRHEYLLTANNQHLLSRFIAARDKDLIARSVGVVRSGLYRQSTMGNIGLVVATLLKKI